MEQRSVTPRCLQQWTTCSSWLWTEPLMLTYLVVHTNSMRQMQKLIVLWHAPVEWYQFNFTAVSELNFRDFHRRLKLSVCSSELFYTALIKVYLFNCLSVNKHYTFFDFFSWLKAFNLTDRTTRTISSALDTHLSLSFILNKRSRSSPNLRKDGFVFSISIYVPFWMLH